MSRRESAYVKSLVVVALAAVLTAAAFPRPWLTLVYPAAGVLFAAGGAAAASRLDAVRTSRGYVLRAALALLVPFWLFGAAVVTAMLVTGWSWDAEDGTAPLTWSTAWLWLLPLADPPVSSGGSGLAGAVWFVRVYLWLVVLTPPLLWLSRRWPLRVMAVPLTAMALVTVGIANPLGRTADVVLGLSAYTGCWLLGFAHRDGRLRRVPAAAALGAGAVLAAAGITVALWQQPHHGSYSLDVNPAAAMLYSLGGVLLLLRVDPWTRGLDRLRWLDPALSLFHSRTLTAFLWVNVVIALTPPLLAASPLAGFHTATPRGALLAYTATWVLLLATLVVLGWVEDLGAGRRPRLLPLRRRRAAAGPAPVAARPDVAAPPELPVTRAVFVGDVAAEVPEEVLQACGGAPLRAGG
jgi:hypothetical protein